MGSGCVGTGLGPSTGPKVQFPKSLYWLIRPGTTVGSSVLASLVRALYTYQLAPRLYHIVPPYAFSWWVLVKNGTESSFFCLLVVAGGASGMKVFNGWHVQQQLSQLLRQRQLKTELALLRAPLQPTFLFNSLRTLHTLTAQKSTESPTAVLELAALLRYLLYESAQETVPLAKEADMLRHYVALEQLRLGPQVEVSLSFSGLLGHHRIAPLLLPFVENAFQHTAHTPHKCPWISLDLVVKADSLTFKIISSQPDADAGPGTPPAFANIRERLARLYPGHHRLKVLPEPDSLLVALHLQLAPASAPGPRRPARLPSHLIPQP